ncbi:MAG: HD domain-containing protein [Lachnospiraceae bacterium]|nr:HD domain-containing protein [Lachnospiraceae bacterium]
MKPKDEVLFHTITKKLRDDEKIKRMNEYMQHGRVSTFEHVERVARTAFRIDKFFHFKSKEKELLRGAYLHDYFLYDWHHHDGPLHGPYHPKAALKNALKDFKDLTEREKNIIESHMWPLNITRIPRCREAVIVCVADKIVSIKETLFMRR